MLLDQKIGSWWRSRESPDTSMPPGPELSPQISAVKSKAGWWISFFLRWGLLFSLINNYDPLRWLTPYRPGTRILSASWFAQQVFGLEIPWGLLLTGFMDPVADLLLTIPLALIWTSFDRRPRSNQVISELVHLMVRFSLAAGMLQYGGAKVIGDQGITQPDPLGWFRPLGEISTGTVMWTWLGYSKSFEFFAGVNETLGGILLLFRRTTLLGALLVLPVMIYVTTMDVTFHVGPQARATVFTAAALYLAAREGRRLAGVFIGKPTVPTVRKTLWASPEMALVRRGLWVFVVGVIVWTWVATRYREQLDIAGPQSPFCGAYRVKNFVSDGRVLSEEADDAARWRTVAINCFGDFIRIRRMDDAEMLWSGAPGFSYRFAGPTGSIYKLGDYRALVAKTAGAEAHLRFRELPNFRSPHQGKPSNELFTVNFVRRGSDRVSMQGRIDGAEISADLLRIGNNDFTFFRSRRESNQ